MDSSAATQSAPAPQCRGVLGRLTAMCRHNAGQCLALIVVLVIMLVFMFVYYHGVMHFGPYAAAAHHRRAFSPSCADPETEELIDTINNS
jgi:hypothetical protein